MSEVQATRICAVCQKPFVCKESPSHIARGAGKFCSRACQGLSKRIPDTDKFLPRTCASCGTAFLIEPSEVARGGGVFCSTACYHKSRERPLAERFWEKVEKSDGCWLWTGAKSDFGYGFLFNPTVNGPINQHAHRASWELHYGPIPEGSCVLHSCDVPGCVRPDHLFLGTLKDNTQDMLRKRRHLVKLTDEQVAELRQRYATGDISQEALAEEFGLGQSTVSRILNRRNSY